MDNKEMPYTRAIELETYRKDAITAAEELLYDDEIIKKLLFAKSIFEISCIMTTARKSS